MSIPQVAIIGRPNVGKSSIFNWLAGRRLAIVDDVAGVTRDRMMHLLYEGDKYFEIVDTGGIGINDVDDLTTEIEQQIQIGIDSASLILFVVDARDGMTTLDQTIAKRLRTTDKPIILVANKCDGPKQEASTTEFFSFGYGTPVKVSATNKRGRDELLDTIVDRLPEAQEVDDKDVANPTMKIAIVGRRNVGKSTFVNMLTQSERMIVSEVAGTTRDSVDCRFEQDGQVFIAIDTPGLRKRKSVRTDVDFYGLHRAQRSIRHADVVFMFFDAGQRISSVDQQLCNYIFDNNKPCILVVNKWDLMAEHLATEDWSNYLRENFPNMWNVPIAFITGQTGKNVKKLINHAQMIFNQSRMRISTPQLNKLIRTAIDRHPPPLIGHHRPKIYYATQVDIQPPTIVLMCNDPGAFPNSYQRYLKSVLYDQLEFGEVPIRLILRARGSEDLSEKKQREKESRGTEGAAEPLVYHGTADDDFDFGDYDFNDSFGEIPYDDSDLGTDLEDSESDAR